MKHFKFLPFFLLVFLFSACSRSYSPGPANQATRPYNLVGTIVAQTLTAYPATATPTVTPTATPPQSPQDFIDNYFNAINARAYTLTWSLLSDRFKDVLHSDSQGGYQVYVDFWDSVRQASVLGVEQACQGDPCQVNVTLQLDFTNGQSDTSIYPYTLTYDPTRNTWLFDILPVSTPTPASLSTPAGLPIATASPPLTRPEYGPGELADYVVRSGDSLPALAAHFDTTSEAIRAANPGIPANVTTLAPGLLVKIPLPASTDWGTPLQVMPDSLFINGPSAGGFDAKAFISSQPGWLRDYREEIGGGNPSGAELVAIVSTNFSINPRALLVLLEYQAGALSQPLPPAGDYPLGHVDPAAAGLYKQMVWAANLLNAGYYGWRTGGLTQLVHPDYSVERPDPWQNAATLAFQYYYSQRSLDEYARATGPDGLRRVAFSLFGDPWSPALDQPHIPADLGQPALVLPFPAGYAWSFTGGPHSAWGAAALRPWAAIDFAPPVRGCAVSEVPVVAVADGIVARSEAGVVVLDLDGDGNERTGWNMFYFHISSHAQARLGQRLKRGDPLGFASCEGGMATGTHVHIARKYNGEWMPVDGAIPFDLEGWIAHPGESFYKGTLTRNSQVVTASSYGSFTSMITAGE